MKEMSAGILQQDDSSGEEGTGDIDQLSLNPPVQRDKKKTKKQRRKENQQHIKVRYFCHIVMKTYKTIFGKNKSKTQHGEINP